MDIGLVRVRSSQAHHGGLVPRTDFPSSSTVFWLLRTRHYQAVDGAAEDEKYQLPVILTTSSSSGSRNTPPRQAFARNRLHQAGVGALMGRTAMGASVLLWRPHGAWHLLGC